MDGGSRWGESTESLGIRRHVGAFLQYRFASPLHYLGVIENPAEVVVSEGVPEGPGNGRNLKGISGRWWKFHRKHIRGIKETTIRKLLQDQVLSQASIKQYLGRGGSLGDTTRRRV